jgi:cytochrome c5
MTASEWNAVVQNMVAHGATASDDEVKAIVDYLAATLGR